MSKKDTRRLFVLWTVVLFCIIAIFPTTAQENLTDIVKKISPSVVMVLTYDKEGEVLTRGSGFFIGKERDVITNRHVLLNAERAEIKTADKKVYPIKKVVAEDKEGDLIRVSVEVPQNTIRPLSVSDSIPEVGEQVVVIGSPLGLEQTVSNGIVSAVRDIPEFGKIVQVSAPISPGSSGSPVVNMKGEVIGVATFQMVEGQNLNFAVPAERLAKLKPDKGKTFAEWKASIKEKWITSAEGLYFTGGRFFGRRNYKKALSYFKKAVKKNPRYADAYVYMGCAYKRLKRYKESIEAFKQAIRIKPDYAEAHYNLGLTYLILEDTGSAFEEYKILKNLDKDLANKLFNSIYR